MLTRTRTLSLTWLLILILAVSACSAPAPALDTSAIAGTVAAQLEAGQPEPAATPDLPALQATILAEVEARLQELPDELSADEVAQLVDERIAQQLAQQAEVVRVAQTEVTAALAGADVEMALVDLYRVANPAVVYIIVPPATSGSGFVYDREGHIVTNNHVVAGGRGFEVIFAGGERMTAELVGTDPDSDLAVLKVDELPVGVEPLPLAQPDSLHVGQFVAAIGNPFGEQGSMSLGIVSGLGRSLRSQRGTSATTAYSLPSVIQTDAPINPGNSGGPLLNLDGEVVGVNSAIASTTGVNSGVGFSVPVIAVRRIVPNLIQDGRHVYGFMGVSFDEEISLNEQEQFDLPQFQGAYVVSVTPDGPGDQAGLVAANANNGRGGDLIVAIDGVPIRNFADLNSYLVFNATADQTIQVTVLRDGEELTLPLTLGERP